MIRHIKTIYIYMGVGCALVAAVIALVASIEAKHQNEISLRSQYAVVQYETGDIYRELGGKLMAIAYWQETYEHTVLEWDQAWVDYQFGPYLETIGVRNVAIYRSDGRLRYLRMDSTSLPDSFKHINRIPGLQALISAASDNTNKSPTQARSGVFILGNKPFFGIAAQVRPERINPYPNENDGKYIVVFFRPALVSYYDALNLGFDSTDSRITLIPNTSDHYATHPLRDAAGVPRAYFEWQPQRPGANFLLVLYPVLAVMFLLLATMLTISITRWNSAQKTLHEIKAQATRTEEESRIKAVFFGNISHELRTPLNAIIGFADMLKMQLFGKIENPRYNEYIDHILSSGNELLRIVTALIEISHIETQRQDIERHPIDAANALETAASAVHKVLTSRSVEIDLCLPDEPVWCLGSAGRLHQALVQLLENAIYATPRNEKVRATCRIDQQNITFAISDRRHSAAPICRQNFGKLFLYSDNHYLAHADGAGIGLVIAAALARLMSGQLDYRYEPDGTFTIQMHLTRAEPQKQPEASPPKNDASAAA